MGNHGDEDDLTGKQGNNNIDDEVSSSVFSDDIDDMSVDDGKDIESKREVAAALRSLLKNPEVQDEVLTDGLIQALKVYRILKIPKLEKIALKLCAF